ncbi:MAG: tetratricopeptide repeat protein [Methylotenera sp.]|nr:tetratricopeptide repeat protein [Methylotenera sp.]
MKNLILAGLLIVTAAFAVQGHAALFDDKEARKKILELEATSITQHQAVQTELAALKKTQQTIEQRLAEIEAITKGQGLLDMQNQIEALKQELAKVKGELELASHNVNLTQQRQKDLYGDADARLRKLEQGQLGSTANVSPTAATESPPATSAAPAAASAGPSVGSTPEPAKNSQEYQLLELANGLAKEAKYKDAFNAYDKFLKDYPNSTYAADAMYGLGYAQFALKNYKSAMATQQKLLDAHPDHPRAADALFNMANSQFQLGLVPAAKKTLRDLIAKFPGSEVIPAAQKRLKALDAIK